MRPAILAKLAVVLALLIALAGTGFAHRALPSDHDDSLLDYLVAGGSYADICSDTGLGQGGGETCDACRLVDSFAAPDSTFACSARLFLLVGAWPSLAGLVRGGGITDPSRPVRAPPVV